MMRLHGIHHITAITGDAPANVDFYVRVMGLRMVKKTVNFDQPDVYHLYYASEAGDPGSVLTFFEYPGVPRGTAGAGMIHRIRWRAGSLESLDFWERRLEAEGAQPQRVEGGLAFSDPEGLGLEIRPDESGDPPLQAAGEGIPAEHALRGFDGVAAYARVPGQSKRLLEVVLGFDPAGEQSFKVNGDRHAEYTYDDAPAGVLGAQGAGTVHHIAWACEPDDQPAWRDRVAAAGAAVTPIIDRTYFFSIYFREPSGVLFEIATLGPGFGVDEPLQALGQTLTLPPRFEPMRAELEGRLTPIGPAGRR